MKNVNLNDVQEAAEFQRLTPDGYICRIVLVEDKADREYLRVEYDIADGKFKDYYKSLNESRGFWGGSFIRSYTPNALPFFKQFISAVEKSNIGYKFDYNEQGLVGKSVGLVLGEEEYTGNDGTIKIRLYVSSVCSADAIRKGDFKVPALKKLSGSAPPSTNTSSVIAPPPTDSDFEELLDGADFPF